MNKLSSEDVSSLLRLAASLPTGDESRRAILSGLKKLGGYDKSVWSAAPGIHKAEILEHLGRPRQPGSLDPIPYYTGFPRTHFVGKKTLSTDSRGQFVLGHDRGEPAVQWTNPSGDVSYFLAPMPD